MEAENTPVIPTRYRSKIPSALSYPVGSELVSGILRDVPQFADLEIHFFFQTLTYEAWRHSEVRQVVRMSYHRYGKSPPRKDLYPVWGVTVYPVLREEKYIIREKLIPELVHASQWLRENAHLKDIGASHIIFSFDKRNECIVIQMEKDLAPVATKVNR